MTDTGEKPSIDEPVKIVPPDDFPVEWDSPEEAGLLWSWDNFHAPTPPSPMSTSFGEFTRKGSEAANRTFGREPGRSCRKFVNGYPYSVVEPGSGGDRDDFKQKLADAAASLEKRWVEEFLPELEADIAEMKAVDLDSLSDDRVMAHVDYVLQKANRHWEIHFLVVFPVHAAMDRLKETYEKLVGEGAGEEVYALVDSTDTMTMEVNRALARLGMSARSSGVVSADILAGLDVNQTIKQLRESAEGRRWLAEFDSFMDAYGYRPSGYDMRFKTWREDPSFVFVNVRGHISADREALAEGNDTAARVRVEERVDAALDGLDEPGEEIRAEFDERLARVREVWHLKEDHGFYIDQASSCLVRMAIAELGRRLARKGVIDDGEDVFFLELGEASKAMSGLTPMQDVVSERAARIEAWSELSPVRFLGTIPTENPPKEAIAQVRMAEDGDESRALEGQPASAGRASGPARVVITPAQFGKVKQGDVLVCRSTSPTWTPLFSIVCALVSEAGGVLSHPAIIAREHGLPAVVGVIGATDLIVDGQFVEVDGDSGVVRISGVSGNSGGEQR
ncbi:MAG: hypothetical protein IIB28_05595 [Chloroflexi bacterium]|nr:hypothetical protein [Chloroflexota bacterium]